jgi:N-acetylglucosaminyldiphosphoundecaprenol N-acetyl-beta-D-mannosaminyltransferase
VTREAGAKTRFLGVDIDSFDRASFLDAVLAAVEERRRLTVTFLNPFYARRAARSRRLRDLMNSFDILQPDGWGTVYGARLCGIRVEERLAIEDFELELFGRLEALQRGVFLFGSAPGVAERAGETLSSSFPTLRVCGTLHGWWDALAGHPGRYSSDDNEMIVSTVNAAGPDLLIVGLPTPLQQEWVIENAPALEVPVIMTAGAYFDKLAERLSWYPRWMDRARLDWLYRIVREPRRLAPRYLVGSFDFAFLLGRELSRRRH